MFKRSIRGNYPKLSLLLLLIWSTDTSMKYSLIRQMNLSSCAHGRLLQEYTRNSEIYRNMKLKKVLFLTTILVKTAECIFLSCICE